MALVFAFYCSIAAPWAQEVQKPCSVEETEEIQDCSPPSIRVLNDGPGKEPVVVMQWTNREVKKNGAGVGKLSSEIRFYRRDGRLLNKNTTGVDDYLNLHGSRTAKIDGEDKLLLVPTAKGVHAYSPRGELIGSFQSAKDSVARIEVAGGSGTDQWLSVMMDVKRNSGKQDRTRLVSVSLLDLLQGRKMKNAGQLMPLNLDDRSPSVKPHESTSGYVQDLNVVDEGSGKRGVLSSSYFDGQSHIKYFNSNGKLVLDEKILNELPDGGSDSVVVSQNVAGSNKTVRSLVFVDGAMNERTDVLQGFKKVKSPDRRVLFYNLSQPGGRPVEIKISQITSQPFLLNDGLVAVLTGVPRTLVVYDATGKQVSTLELPKEGLYDASSFDVTREGFVTVMDHKNKISGFYKLDPKTSAFVGVQDPGGKDDPLSRREWVGRALKTTAGQRVLADKNGELFFLRWDGSIAARFSPRGFCYGEKITPPQEFSGGRYAYGCGKKIFVIDSQGRELARHEVPDTGKIDQFQVLWNGSIVFSSPVDSSVICPRSKVTFLNLFPFSCPKEEDMPSQSSRTHSGKDEQVTKEISTPTPQTNAVPARLEKER